MLRSCVGVGAVGALVCELSEAGCRSYTGTDRLHFDSWRRGNGYVGARTRNEESKSKQSIDRPTACAIDPRSNLLFFDRRYLLSVDAACSSKCVHGHATQLTRSATQSFFYVDTYATHTTRKILNVPSTYPSRPSLP